VLQYKVYGVFSSSNSSRTRSVAWAFLQQRVWYKCQTSWAYNVRLVRVIRLRSWQLLVLKVCALTADAVPLAAAAASLEVFLPPSSAALTERW